MILPELILPECADQHWQFSGIDRRDRCLDPEYFDAYPHTVSYDYNSRGFRDQEWPVTESELQNAVWCIGDSFTSGVGAPVAHNWPTRLAALCGRRTINVSMDGASNSWISRTVQQITAAVNPAHMVVMWSYTHRRELDDPTLTDHERRVWFSDCSAADDWRHFAQCRKTVPDSAVEFSIPGFHHSQIDLDQAWAGMRESGWPAGAPQTLEEFNSLPSNVVEKIKNKYPDLNQVKREIILAQQRHDITPTRMLDRARDGHHFDVVTADWVAAEAVAQLNL